MAVEVKTVPKLIEVALPLDDIDKAAVREKSIRHGHPSALHLWWARRPLAAARVVLFAQLVDDPSGRPDLGSSLPSPTQESNQTSSLDGCRFRDENWRLARPVPDGSQSSIEVTMELAPA